MVIYAMHVSVIAPGVNMFPRLLAINPLVVNERSKSQTVRIDKRLCPPSGRIVGHSESGCRSSTLPRSRVVFL